MKKYSPRDETNENRSLIYACVVRVSIRLVHIHMARTHRYIPFVSTREPQTVVHAHTNMLASSGDTTTLTLPFPIPVLLGDRPVTCFGHDMAQIEGVSHEGHVQWRLPGRNGIISGTRNMLASLVSDNIRFDRIYIRCCTSETTAPMVPIGIPLLSFCQHATVRNTCVTIGTQWVRPIPPLGLMKHGGVDRVVLFPTRMNASTTAGTSGTDDWLLRQNVNHDGGGVPDGAGLPIHTIEYSYRVENDDGDDDDFESREIDYPDTPVSEDEEEATEDVFDFTCETWDYPKEVPKIESWDTIIMPSSDDVDNYASLLPRRSHELTRALPVVFTKQKIEYENKHLRDIAWRSTRTHGDVVYPTATVMAAVSDDVHLQQYCCRICFSDASQILCFPNMALVGIDKVPCDMTDALKMHMLSRRDECFLVQLTPTTPSPQRSAGCVDDDSVAVQCRVCIHCLRRMIVDDRTMLESLLQRALIFDDVAEHALVVQCPITLATTGHLPVSTIHNWLLWTQDEHERFDAAVRRALLTRTLTTTAEETAPSPLDASTSTHALVCPFFFRPPAWRQASGDFLLYTHELTPELCRDQIVDAATANDDDFSSVAVTCPVCTQHLTKTMACNAMAHCGVEICNVCGLFTFCSSTASSGSSVSPSSLQAHPYHLLYPTTTTHKSTLPLSHWDERGLCGCPRWDTDVFWARRCHVRMRCDAMTCGDNGETECTDVSHMESKRQMNVARFFNMVYHKLLWLYQHSAAATSVTTTTTSPCKSFGDTVEELCLTTIHHPVKAYIIAEAARCARYIHRQNGNKNQGLTT